jgi:hypothetical protein
MYFLNSYRKEKPLGFTPCCLGRETRRDNIVPFLLYLRGKPFSIKISGTHRVSETPTLRHKSPRTWHSPRNGVGYFPLSLFCNSRAFLNKIFGVCQEAQRMVPETAAGQREEDSAGRQLLKGCSTRRTPCINPGFVAPTVPQNAGTGARYREVKNQEQILYSGWWGPGRLAAARKLQKSIQNLWL